MSSNQKVYFDSDGNTLAGTLYHPDDEQKHPGVLFLHGAGDPGTVKFNEWLEYLAQHGYTCFIFTVRGVGDSQGDFKDGSLNNRLIDAQNALQFFLTNAPVDPSRIAVVGNSMSGQTAIRLTEHANIKALILAYAAAYFRRSRKQTTRPHIH